MRDFDIIVVGAGNAALAAANSAREEGADRVLVLEKASEAERGGNTWFSGGLLRIAYGASRALEPLLPDVEERLPGFFDNVEPYTEEDFLSDLRRVTAGRADPMLARILIENSYQTIRWMHEAAGVPMEAAVSLAGIRVGNRVKFQKGAIVRARQEGIGLSRSWFAHTERNGIEIRYETGALSLLRDRSGRVVGVEAKTPSGMEELSARAVVLACGGFEANAQWRAQYLGAPWDHAKVRGTAHNQGDGLRMALAAGALPRGQWSGRHSTPISNEWPDFADRKRTDKSNRLSYPFGVMINRAGRRFVDEGEDLGFYTYAKYGGEILRQPGSLAWQIFDQQDDAPARAPLPDERTDHLRYPRGSGRAARHRRSARRRCAPSMRTTRRRAITAGFDPTVLDGLATTRARAAQVELGAAARRAAVRRLLRHRRHHLHLRRTRDRRAGEGARHRLAPDARALHLRRDGRRALPLQLPRRDRPCLRRGVRPHRGAVCGAGAGGHVMCGLTGAKAWRPDGIQLRELHAGGRRAEV